MKRMISMGLLIVLTLTLMVGCAGNAISEPNPFPFCDAKWTSSQSDLATIMGRGADEEYDTDDGFHVLQFNNCEYDGYPGLIRYCYDGEELDSALFEFNYDEETYQHFDEAFTSEYGDPDFENEAGKVWYTDNGNIGLVGVSVFGGGMLLVKVTQPGAQEE